MSTNLNITIYDFKSICRTCLSREDLKPLYGKYSDSTCFAEMLMACTFVKIAEDDGLPAKICSNCIKEINQAFSFAKRCETTDTILRKCVKIKTELTTNSSQSQIVEPKEEKPNMHRTLEKGGDYEYVEVKQEEELIIENEYDETYDYPADESYEENVDEDQDDNFVSRSRHRPTNSQIEAKKLDLLKAHQRIPTKNEEGVRQYACNVCGKAFSQWGLFKTHKLIHTGEKPHVCSICSKAFIHRRSLNFHMKIHSDKRSYTCEVCNKAFIQSIHLKYHMRLHTGEKPYACEVCNKAFSHPSNLNYHKRIHTGANYVCEVCNKTFIQPNRLKYHLRLHTGKKPYICEVCSKAFTESRGLKKHMRIHTG